VNMVRIVLHDNTSINPLLTGIQEWEKRKSRRPQEENSEIVINETKVKQQTDGTVNISFVIYLLHCQCKRNFLRNVSHV